jgi:hypothetical protein
MAKQPGSAGSGMAILVTWAEFNGALASEKDLIDTISLLRFNGALPALIRFLRFGDAGNAPRFRTLDEHIEELFPNNVGRWVGSQLATSSDREFFTRWQLLLAIKLICTFGATDEGDGEVRPEDLLKLLLMINDFVHRDHGDSGPLDTNEQQLASVKSQILKCNVPLHHEPPIGLIGRYSDILGSRAGVQRQSCFNSWFNVDQIARSTLGVGITDLRLVLLAVYASLPNTVECSESEDVGLFPFSEEDNEQSLPFCFDPIGWFVNTTLPKETLTRVVDLVTCSPDQIREEHMSKYGTGVGRMFDIGVLLRRPVIRMSDSCFAGLSRYLVAQRSTSGVYWDIQMLYRTIMQRSRIEVNSRNSSANYTKIMAVMCLRG